MYVYMNIIFTLPFYRQVPYIYRITVAIQICSQMELYIQQWESNRYFTMTS